jgi:hypothetical protein
MNVMSGGFIPDHIKALNVAYHWYSTNEIYFQEGDINHTQYGWIREDKNGESLICFDEDQLRKQISASLGANRYESAVTKWRDLEIINTRKIKEKGVDGNEIGKIKVLKTVQIKVNNRNTTVIQIPLRNFYKHLNIAEDSKPNTGTTIIPDGDRTNTKPVYENTNESDYIVPIIAANTPASSSHGFNQVTSVTASNAVDSDIFVTGSDIEAYEIMTREGLV